MDWRFEDAWIVFEGARPKASGAAFREIYDNREWGGEVWTNQPVKSVCYIDGARGWVWGETWCNVRTYSVESVPSEYRVASAVRFSGKPHKGFGFRGKRKGVPFTLDQYELDCEDPMTSLQAGGDVVEYRSTDGSFFAIPVSGAKSKSDVRPILQLLTAKSDMIAKLEIWTDEEMRSAVMVGDTSGWDVDEDEGRRECERFDERTLTSYYRGWDFTLWPEGRSDSGRHWVFVRLNNEKYLNSTDFGGDYTFRVGLGGRANGARRCTLPLRIRRR